jgi:predicted DNA-binding transcriptional regulator YafY
VPVEGEAGIGYRLRPDYDVPPLMFTSMEVEAMVAGLRLLKAWGGGWPRRPILVEKLMAARRNGAAAQQSRIFAPECVNQPAVREALTSCIRPSARNACRIDYSDAQQRSVRVVQPLGLFFWGNVWLLAAWCTTRSDYRSFRLDRCRALTMLDEHFLETSERSLNGFLRTVQSDTQG